MNKNEKLLMPIIERIIADTTKSDEEKELEITALAFKIFRRGCGRLRGKGITKIVITLENGHMVDLRCFEYGDRRASRTRQSRKARQK